MPTSEFPLLQRISEPADLRDLSMDELQTLVGELRSFLLQSVSRSGGHFAAGLGVVELTIALHHVFHTPEDRLIWDVGHQCYPHKVLTGRGDALPSIRQSGGLAPFPRREESPFDAFGVGHSSTSVSAALGMALAARHKGDPRKTVAVIGDGAMTAGMAFEGLNHLGDVNADVLVVLNDNEMSISPNVGALNNYLTRMLSGRVYSSMREGSKRLLEQVPPVWELARRTEEHVKGMLAPGTLFEEFGIHYFGPTDGHDLAGLIRILRNLKHHNGPRLLHTVTRKGKGYPPAEEDPVGYHAVPRFDPGKGVCTPTASVSPSYTQVFGDWLCDMAARDPTIVAITPAMAQGSGLVGFAERFPDRCFDVGIAEQHAVTLAAGLACEGLKPVVAIYSTFLQRAYDQLIHDVALQRLPVLFAIDRAGIVGPDGPTHTGNFDLSFLRSVPGLTIMAPSDENECRQMLYTGILQQGPVCVRYPRGTGPGVPVEREMAALPVGRARILRDGGDIAMLAFGSPVAEAVKAAGTLNASVYDMRFVKPLDEQAVRQAALAHRLLLTVEDNTTCGGAGSAVGESLNRMALSHPPQVVNLGLPDRFPDHGDRGNILREYGLDAEGIISAVDRVFRGGDCVGGDAQVAS